MDFVNLLGSVAGILTTTSILPQVIKTWKTKSAKDLSIAMIYLLAAGVLLWIVYGILIRAYPIIIANSVPLVLVTTLIALKMRYEQ